MHRFLTLTFFCLFFFYADANQSPGDNENDRLVRIFADERIERLLEEAYQIHKENQTMRGFRVQLYESPGRTAIFKVQGEFLKKYPEIATYIVYQQPTFKLRAGDFVSRLDATRLWNKIRDSFPSSFVIQDEIQIVLPEKAEK